MKKVLYWVTVVPALADAVKGAVSGVRMGLADIAEAKRKAKAAEQEEAFEKANRGEDN